MSKQAKSKSQNKANSFKLTRSEIEKLYKITEHFKDVNLFVIEQDNSGGIGTISTVKFDLFNKNDINIDVTDTGSW